MSRYAQSDVWKIAAYFVVSLLLGAVLAPWIYNFGMGIAEVTEGKDTNSLVSWLGAAARRSQDNFPRFFDRSVLFSALLLLGPLVAWLRLGRGKPSCGDWSLYIPENAAGRPGQRLAKNRRGPVELLFGFMLAAGLLLVSGWLLTTAGFFVWRDAGASARGWVNPLVTEIKWGSVIRRALIAATIVAVIEEFLFRGVLLGIFLRAMQPAAAIVSLSVLFAAVHFLEPPRGATVPDPEALDAGFVLLGQILHHFIDPLALAGRFFSILAVGLVLAVARYRTASLWLPIGLHAGWIFAYQVFKGATWPVAQLPASSKLLVGSTILEGLVPLGLAVVTGMLVMAMTERRKNLPGHG
ncbi:CPBP family intramembrane glutamic endopeptidase [Haloferula sargassicola]|uniref:CPBP family intramembrane glutamic endopeptidase n=1 Tax=Haloferula sargassicola TaxID=490096 RepID=UPI003365AB6F